MSTRYSSDSYWDDEDMDSSGENGESHPVENNVSETFRDDIETILINPNLNWNSTFCYHKTSMDAPNPVLSIKGLGVVGLPSTSRDVESLKRHSLQAGFERSEGDGAMWEVDASKVTFGNPRWTPYIEEVMEDLCDILNPNCRTKNFRCQLKKLSIHGTGSCPRGGRYSNFRHRPQLYRGPRTLPYPTTKVEHQRLPTDGIIWRNSK
ncbi:hypothetical protein PsYK624_034470 [Phanerochaete sordida]|uniref:Uncharacterized protein n=1 Tax=Phanerochaete sordida TaxID=48140 RepID=A0A9P3G4C9_9APHY|nr:hypothetical protein PsYK624_034470 [Phanerochaete sordida]